MSLNKAKGAFIGLAIGDALGTTIEFMERDSTDPVTDLVGGGVFNLPIGGWTDDTSMALCLAESLIESKGFDPLDQAQRYCEWYKNGKFSVKGKCFDIGNTTATALDRFLRTGEPYSGSTDSNQSGNGSIMRLAPIPIAYHHNLSAANANAVASSAITHGATDCLDGCRFLNSVIFEAIAEKDKEYLTSKELFDPKHILSQGIWGIAEGHYKNMDRDDIMSTGYVVHTLEAAMWAFYRNDNFKDTVLEAVNLGNDADTVGAVAGQIAGAYYGIESIPQDWIDKIIDNDIILTFAEKLYFNNIV